MCSRNGVRFVEVGADCAGSVGGRGYNWGQMGRGAGNELHSWILPGGGPALSPQASQSHGALRQIPERVFFGAGV